MRTIVIEGRGPNTLSRALLERLEREIDDAGDAPLLVIGSGDAFSSGLDLDALAKADVAEVGLLLDAMERATRKLFLHPAPTVAAINGHAVAGGCLLAQCCDVRIAVDDAKARFGMTGVGLGLIYPPFVPAVFRARLPLPNAERVLMGSGRVDPKGALELGLVDELAPRTSLRERAEVVLAARAALPRKAYASIKLALREPAYAGVPEAHAAFREEAVPSWTHAIFGSRAVPVL